MENVDLAVIGGGPGGYPAAIRAAQKGASVALIEKESLGGTCLNRGCIPTKTLIGATGLYDQLRNAGKLGINVSEAGLDYKKMCKHKDKVVRNLAKGVEQLLQANKVAVYNGEASFRDSRTLKIKTEQGEETDLKAERVIIATGSESFVPDFLPKHERIVDSRAFLQKTQLPASMIIMGGGYIGCEIACMAAMAGVQVTVVEMLEDILMLLDADVRSVVRKEMEKKHGVKFMVGHPMENVEADDNGVTAIVNDEQLTADMLLVAAGRHPVTENLELKNADLTVDENGYIPVDSRNRTDVGGIYAVGDVNGITPLAHAATSQGTRAAEHACGESPPQNKELIPGVIFTSPEVATVGISEEEANKEGKAVKTGEFPFSALGRAATVNETTGFVKWITDGETGQLLGAQAVGPHATDLIAEACVAVRGEFTANELGATIHAHPTFNEAWMEAAHAVDGHAIHKPPQS